jgi:ABC-2 type transport system permease protein
MNSLVNTIISSRLWALVVKETREILRNKYLLFLILVPPILQLLILGGALDPQVRNLSLATVDHAKTADSRELLEQILARGTFKDNKILKNEDVLSSELEKGHKTIGIVIPSDFSAKLKTKDAQVQVLVDGADAYTAGIASAEVQRTILEFKSDEKKTREENKVIDPQINILYNPDQLSSWYFVPGVLGACLTLTGTLVASATVLRERESGTMEQLLMTPASASEILLAKIIPLASFLLLDVVVAITASRMIFGMPCRGSFLLLLIASALYSFVGIGVGMLLGSVCRSQRQAQLASFFINIPLILLSGTVVPLDTMPGLLQAVSVFDPLRYYAQISRGILLKGATLEMLWLPVLLLALSAVIILSISANRFKRQLV